MNYYLKRIIFICIIVLLEQSQSLTGLNRVFDPGGGIWCLREVRIRVPQAVRAHTQIRLICEYDLENTALYSVKWYKDDVEFFCYVPKEDPPAKIFEVDPPIHVNLASSDAHIVVLNDITLSHSGTYKCEVTADAPLFQTDIKSDHMLVVEIITTDGEPQVTSHISESRRGHLEHLLICRGPPASVRANITWYINDQMVSKSDTDIIIRELSDEIRDENDGLIVARSELRMRSLQHSAVLVRCEVTLFDVYTASAEHRIRAIAPPPVGPMMDPTAPLGLSDSAISTTVNNGAATSTKQQIAVIFITASTVTSLLIMNFCFN